MSNPLEDLKQMLFKFGYKHPDEAKPFKELADERAEMQAAIVELREALGKVNEQFNKMKVDKFGRHKMTKAEGEHLWFAVSNSLNNTKKWGA